VSENNLTFKTLAKHTNCSAAFKAARLLGLKNVAIRETFYIISDGAGICNKFCLQFVLA